MQSMHVATIVNTEYAAQAEPIFWVEVIFGPFIARIGRLVSTLAHLAFLEGFST